MIIEQQVKIFKLNNSYAVVIPSKILNRCRLDKGAKLKFIYDDNIENDILIKIIDRCNNNDCNEK